MKITIALLAAALGASIPLQAANASDESGAVSLTKQTQNQDISAAKKKKRGYVHVYPQYGYYGYYHAYPMAFASGDPSYQSPEQVRLRALNRCFFDLGYGRWKNCN